MARSRAHSSTATVASLAPPATRAPHIECAQRTSPSVRRTRYAGVSLTPVSTHVGSTREQGSSCTTLSSSTAPEVGS